MAPECHYKNVIDGKYTNQVKNIFFARFESSQIHEDGRVFDSQMTSCTLRYDVIYHPSPINSQYLNTSSSGVDSPVSALYGKEFLIKCLLYIDPLVTLELQCGPQLRQ